MRRAFVVGGLLAVWLTATMTGTQAHALLGESTPADGTSVDAAPNEVTIRFTEAPELALSDVDVLDAEGRSYADGPLTQDRTDPEILTRAIAGLSEGVFTVTWRVISQVDGHLTAGAFAFGVGVDPSEVAAAPRPADSGAPPPSALEIIARWLFFIGMGLMVGAAVIGASVLGARIAVWPIATGWGLGALGLALLAEAQRRAAGTTYGTLLDTGIGRSLIWRAIGLGLAGLAIVVARTGTRRWALGIVGAAGAGAIWMHVAAGHAGAGSWPAKVASQWVHFVAASLWLGGLAALLIGVRGEPSDERAHAVKRFSGIALLAFLAVLATGLVRAFNELPTWGDLVGSGYGKLIIAKAALLVVLGVLAAVNRYRNVPAARTSLRGLRRVARMELVLGVGLLAAAGALASVTPPEPVSALETIAAEPITAVGTDGVGRVEARLTISPGVPGPNEFSLRLTQVPGGEPFDADGVRLLFRYVEDGAFGESELPLMRADDGTWQASSASMALPGRWRVSVLAQRATDSVEIGVTVATKCRAVSTPVEGLPTLHDVMLGRGSAQGYVDPGEEGFNEAHITFFDADGVEIDVAEEPLMWATPIDGDRLSMVVRRFGPGHFLGDAQLTPGVWRFDVEAQVQGETIRLCFNDEIDEG